MEGTDEAITWRDGRPAFFCYGNEGGNELDDDRRPRVLRHKEWFDPSHEPYQGDERKSYQSLVWQCRYSGIEVPDELWRHASVGLGQCPTPTIRRTTWSREAGGHGVLRRVGQ